MAASYLSSFALTTAEYMAQIDCLRREDLGLLAAIEKAKAQLVRDGFAVIPGVYSLDECAAYRQQFWSTLHHVSDGRFPADEPRSDADLRNARLHKKTKEEFRVSVDWFSNKHGIFEQGVRSITLLVIIFSLAYPKEFAHLPICYNVRTNPKIALVYALLYGRGDYLVTAADRINYQLQPEYLAHSAQRNKKLLSAEASAAWTDSTGQIHPSFPIDLEATWLHVDQSRLDTSRKCIQGLVQFTDALIEGNASLECVPGTHRDFPDLEKHLGENKTPRENWYKFSDEQKKMPYFNGKRLISVRAPAGSLILWDSRLMHQGGRIRSSLERDLSDPDPRFVIVRSS